MNSLEKLFAAKKTENGDDAYCTTGNKYLDILFMTEYYNKHVNEVPFGYNQNDELTQLFAMFIRDPRFGIGRRDLGIELMGRACVPFEDVVLAGRYDDLLKMKNVVSENVYKFMWNQVLAGNELAKKWMPRFNTKGEKIARDICRVLKLTQKEYRKAIKANTVENMLSNHRDDEINYEHVPSLAMIKYYNKFMQNPRFKEYLENVKKGNAKLNVSTTTVYDIYKNRDKIDADIFFDKLEKIKISCIPILDTSGSMQDTNDSIGKATSIAYYLAKCSTYCNNHVVSFSSRPQLIEIKEMLEPKNRGWGWSCAPYGVSSKFAREMNSMYTGDCSNTDFGAVINLLSNLDEFPEYFVVLSDMEFDMGSNQSKSKVMKMFKDKGIKTKIVWWNISNGRGKTVPETDEYGNIFMSGYNPYLLKYLESSFDGERFLSKLLSEYKKNIRRE